MHLNIMCDPRINKLQNIDVFPFLDAAGMHGASVVIKMAGNTADGGLTSCAYKLAMYHTTTFSLGKRVFLVVCNSNATNGYILNSASRWLSLQSTRYNSRYASDSKGDILQGLLSILSTLISLTLNILVYLLPR